MEGKLCVEINEACRFQKFRYKTEQRKGQKQHKDMVTVTFHDPEVDLERCKINLLIFCVSADEPHRLHPNNLTGKVNCNQGVYQVIDVNCQQREIKKGVVKIKVPYLHIIRTKNEDKVKTVTDTAKYVPEKHRGDIGSQDYYKDVKTDTVRLKVVLEVDDVDYCYLTGKITHHDGGEKVKLNITDLTTCSFKAEDGGETYILTEDKHGPDIKPGDYEVYVKADGWESEPTELTAMYIKYKRLIKYKVPPYSGNISGMDVNAQIVLKCKSNENRCERNFTYTACSITRKRKVLEIRSDEVIKKPCYGFGKIVYEDVSPEPEKSNVPFSLSSPSTEPSDLLNDVHTTMESYPATIHPVLEVEQLSSITATMEENDSDKSLFVNAGGSNFQVEREKTEVFAFPFNRPSGTHNSESLEGSSLKRKPEADHVLNMTDDLSLCNYEDNKISFDSMDLQKKCNGLVEFIM